MTSFDEDPWSVPPPRPGEPPESGDAASTTPPVPPTTPPPPHIPPSPAKAEADAQLERLRASLEDLPPLETVPAADAAVALGQAVTPPAPPPPPPSVPPSFPVPPPYTTPPANSSPPPAAYGVPASPVPPYTYLAAPPAVARKSLYTQPKVLAPAALVVLLVLAAGALMFSQLMSGPSYPSHWDARIAPLAKQAAKLRGLKFDHPVPVHFLPEREFNKKVSTPSTGVSAHNKKLLESAQASLRALGMIDANVDLLKSSNALSKSTVLAYYDPHAGDITVRGTKPLGVYAKATLIHELTHVLQDQHFDLPAIQAAASRHDSSDALRAVTEGDAESVMYRWLRTLPQAQQDEYDQQESSDPGDATDEVSSVPLLLVLDAQTPYVIGPIVVNALRKAHGNKSIDKILSGPPPSNQTLLNPMAAYHSDVKRPSAPTLAPGDKKISSTGTLGPLELYLLLASRIDRTAALDAADEWTGDHGVSYNHAGVTCAALRFARTPSSAALESGLRAWVAATPGATYTENSQISATVTTCDPGASAKEPDHSRLEAAYSLVANRDALLKEVIEPDVLNSPARRKATFCVIQNLARVPALLRLLDSDDPNAELTAAEALEIQTTGAAARATCGL